DRIGLDTAARATIIVQPTAGYDSIDVDYAAQLSLPVANAPGANARGVAEWVCMAALICLKNGISNHLDTQSGHWRMVEASQEGVYDLGGRTLGILGFGAIGQGVAQRLHAFGLNDICYYDQFVRVDSTADNIPVTRVNSLADLCNHSDILSIHVPLTSETRHVIDAEMLDRLGQNSVLINTSRGAVVDENALYHAFTTRALKAAALDVFSQEPLPPNHLWRDLDNVLLSPHLAGSTHESKDNMVNAALSAITDALQGILPTTIVNNITELRGTLY